MIDRARWLAPLALLAWLVPAAADEQPSLAPYQMVRSLQALQDRIAAGDHAALPMQNKLLELIDGRLREAADEEFSEKRNVRAALVYGMSGGNPATLARILNRQPVTDEDRKLGRGVLAYLAGNPEQAQAALGDVDPRTLAPELGAFLALVKGSVSATGNEEAALALFDYARLLGPGTLVEEAALRRSLAIEASLGKPERFFLASRQYVVRFLRSPYASQFADSFITGILALHKTLDYGAIDSITAMMDSDQRQVIYLRLARRAAIEGLTELSAFAARRAKENLPADASDARSRLYSSLSVLTSENIEEVATQLRGIKREQLTESDIRLLEAAEAVVSSVTSAPKLDVTEPAATSVVQAARTVPAPDTPVPVPAIEAEPAAPAEAPSAHDASPATAAENGAATLEAAAPAPAETDPTDTMISDARARLSAIDQMLQEAK
jgi:chemotaxis protein MotC